MTAPEGFGARVIQLMAERQGATGRRLTARSVALDLDIPENSFSRYLRRTDPPGDDVVTPLAEYFGVTRGWLRYGEGQKYVDVVITTKDGIALVEAKRSNPDGSTSPGRTTLRVAESAPEHQGPAVSPRLPMAPAASSSKKAKKAAGKRR